MCVLWMRVREHIYTWVNPWQIAYILQIAEHSIVGKLEAVQAAGEHFLRQILLRAVNYDKDVNNPSK